MFQLTTLGIRNVFLRGWWNLVSALSVFLASALLVIAFAFLEGGRENLSKTLTVLGYGQLNVVGVHKPRPGMVARMLEHPERVESVIRARMPEVLAIRHAVFGDVFETSVSSDVKALSKRVLAMGVDLEGDPSAMAPLQVVEGSLATLAKGSTVLLFEPQARELQVQVGDMVTLTTRNVRGAYDSVDVRVGAIARSLGTIGSEAVLVSNLTARQLFGMPTGAVSALALSFGDSSVELEPLRERLRATLAESGFTLLEDDATEWFYKKQQLSEEAWTGSRLDVTTWKDDLAFIEMFVQLVGVMISTFAAAALVVVLVGLIGGLWVSARQRTQEIGMLRAIGMGRYEVAWLFVVESVVLSTASALGGVLVGTLACVALNAVGLDAPAPMETFLGVADHCVFTPRPMAAVFIVLPIVTVTLLMSCVLALLVSRFKPILGAQHAQ